MSMNKMRPLLLAPLLAALAGCAAGPDYKKPAAPAVQNYTREPVQAGEGQMLAPEAPVDAAWWTAYGSPEIDALVRRALEHNPNVDAAIANLKVAQQNVAAQRGFFYPTIQAGYTGTRQNVGNTLSSPLSSGETIYNLHTAQLSVGFVPDIFGLNRRQVESLKAQEDAQRYQLAAVRITLANNVVTAAFQEAATVEQVRLIEATIVTYREQLKHLQRMHESGYSSAMDVAGAEAALAQALQLLPPLRKQLEQTRDLLAVLCGDFPNQGYQPASLDAIKLPPSLPLGIPSKLVEQRPDVRGAEAQVHSANAQVGVATANMLPQFTITALAGGAATAFSQMFAAGNGIWAIGGGVSQTLFAGGTLIARKRGAEAALVSALAQYQGVVITAFQNVADTLYALENDGRAVQAARDAESANDKFLVLTQKAFNSGYTSEFVLLAAKQAALQSKVARLQAYGTYLSDTAALYQSLGGGWTDRAEDDKGAPAPTARQ
jgi:NodT family efflux transporter outer membrane factor (OMF) lipoprotein